MRVNKATLIEQSSGWVHAQHGAEFKTLRGAVRYVRRDAKRIASGCGAVATLIEYQAATDKGYADVLSVSREQK